MLEKIKKSLIDFTNKQKDKEIERLKKANNDLYEENKALIDLQKRQEIDIRKETAALIAYELNIALAKIIKGYGVIEE